MRRDVAFLTEHRGVIARVARPRLTYPQIEVQAVHLGFDQGRIGDGCWAPTRAIEGGETLLQSAEICGLPGERGRTEVGYAI